MSQSVVVVVHIVAAEEADDLSLDHCWKLMKSGWSGPLLALGLLRCDRSKSGPHMVATEPALPGPSLVRS